MMVLPLFLWLFTAHCTFSSIFPLVKRLRWLLLSIFILNLWASVDFLLALRQVAMLIILILAAHLLIISTPTQDIVAALQWWLWPLKKIGLSTERLAIRLALVMDSVTVVQNLYTEKCVSNSKNPIKKISDTVTALLTQILLYAETTPLRTLEIPDLQSPPLWQWIYILLFLILIFMG